MYHPSTQASLLRQSPVGSARHTRAFRWPAGQLSSVDLRLRPLKLPYSKYSLSIGANVFSTKAHDRSEAGRNDVVRKCRVQAAAGHLRSFGLAPSPRLPPRRGPGSTRRGGRCRRAAGRVPASPPPPPLAPPTALFLYRRAARRTRSATASRSAQLRPPTRASAPA